MRIGSLEDDNVFIFEFNYDQIIQLLAEKKEKDTSFVNFSRFPSAFRDVALLALKDFKSEKIIKEIKAIGGELIKEVTLFDVYEGKNIDKDKVSLAYNIEFNSSKKSLTGEEVNDKFNEMIKVLTSKYDLQLRDE